MIPFLPGQSLAGDRSFAANTNSKLNEVSSQMFVVPGLSLPGMELVGKGVVCGACEGRGTG